MSRSFLKHNRQDVSDGYHSIWIFLFPRAGSFETLIDRTPSLRLALTPSWFTRSGKVKKRANDPYERSETQNLGFVLLFSVLLPAESGLVLDVLSPDKIIGSCFPSPRSPISRSACASGPSSQLWGRSPSSLRRLRTSSYRQRLRVGKLQDEIFLCNTGQLTAELICVLGLSHIKAWSKSLHTFHLRVKERRKGGGQSLLVLVGKDGSGVVLHKAEHWDKDVVGEARHQRHFLFARKKQRSDFLCQ